MFLEKKKLKEIDFKYSFYLLSKSSMIPLIKENEVKSGLIRCKNYNNGEEYILPSSKEIYVETPNNYKIKYEKLRKKYNKEKYDKDNYIEIY